MVAACGAGPDYQYLESDDGHVFAKIPSDWEIEREGAVGYTMINTEQVQFAFTPGDDTQPWRAEFEAPGRRGTVPEGVIESQHIDARWRDSFRLNEFVDGLRESFDGYERTSISTDDFVGYQVTFTDGDGTDVREYNEVYFMDARRSAMYRISMACNPGCIAEYADVIDEVLTTFRVEP